jgi:hypothetical protein
VDGVVHGAPAEAGHGGDGSGFLGTREGSCWPFIGQG